MLHEEKYYTCDRCGKKIHSMPSIRTEYFSCYREFSATAEVRNVQEKKSIFVDELTKETLNEYGVRVDFAIGYGEKKYDLCVKCAKEVKKFIERGVDNDRKRTGRNK